MFRLINLYKGMVTYERNILGEVPRNFTVIV